MSDNDRAPSTASDSPQRSPYDWTQPKLQVTIVGCLVECPLTPTEEMRAYLDVDVAEGTVRLRNIVAECVRASWMLFYGLEAQTNWPGCHPPEAMKTTPPAHVIPEHRQKEFEQAVIEALKKRILNLLLTAEFESRFIEGFKDLVFEIDWVENRVPLD